MATPNPFALLTDAQFAALLQQASGPVIAQASIVNAGIVAMMNGQMTPATLNPQIVTFQTLYATLTPYFTELASRATPVQPPPGP